MLKQKVLSFITGLSMLLIPILVSAEGAPVGAEQDIFAKNLFIAASQNVNPGTTIEGQFVAVNPSDFAVNNYSFTISLFKEDDTFAALDVWTSGTTIELDESSEKSIDFSYKLPQASGNFVIRVSVFSPSGVETGRVEEKIKVSGNFVPLEIKSASLSVDGKQFGLQEGPVVKDSSAALVKVTLKNPGKTDVEIRPEVSIYTKSIEVGEAAINYEGNLATLASGKETSFEVPVRLPDTPEVYEGIIEFKGGNVVAPSVQFRIIRDGKIGTLRNAVADLNELESSDSLNLLVSYTGTPDNITSGTASENYEAVIQVTLFDERGNPVGEGEVSAIVGSEGTEEIRVPLSKKPSGKIEADVKLVSEGKVLDQDTFYLGQIEGSKNPLESIIDLITKNIALIIGIIVAILLALFFLRRKPVSAVVPALAILFAGGAFLGFLYSDFNKANAEEGVDASYVRGGIGCSYEVLTKNRKTDGSFERVTKYKVPCGAGQVYTLDTCNYVTENPNRPGVFTLGSVQKCKSISVDEAKKQCIATLTNDTTKELNNCLDGLYVAETLKYDTSATCVLKYLQAGQEKTKTIQNCATIERTGTTCTYFAAGRVQTLQNCTDMTDEAPDEYEVEASACTVVFTAANGRSVTRRFNNCKNTSIENGVCTYELKVGRQYVSKTQNNCQSIEGYGSSLDVKFLSLVPDAEDGKVYLEPGAHKLIGNVYYPKCTNTPANASLSIVITDSEGRVLPSERFRRGFAVGRTGAHALSIARGGFDAEFTVPETPGKYTILFNASSDNQLVPPYRKIYHRRGYIDFWVRDPNEPQEEGECRDDWDCSAWSACSNDRQTRECDLVEDCPTDNSPRPAQSRLCSEALDECPPGGCVVPSAPQNLGLYSAWCAEAGLDDAGKVRLTYGAPATGNYGVTYEIRRNGSVVATTLQNSFIDTVTPGVTYTYRVTARNAAGVSTPSNEITVPVPTLPCSVYPAAFGPVKIKSFTSNPPIGNKGYQCELKWDFDAWDVLNSRCKISSASTVYEQFGGADIKYSMKRNIEQDTTFKLECDDNFLAGGQFANSQVRYASCRINPNYEEIPF